MPGMHAQGGGGTPRWGHTDRGHELVLAQAWAQRVTAHCTTDPLIAPTIDIAAPKGRNHGNAQG